MRAGATRKVAVAWSAGAIQRPGSAARRQGGPLDRLVGRAAGVPAWHEANGSWRADDTSMPRPGRLGKRAEATGRHRRRMEFVVAVTYKFDSTTQKKLRDLFGHPESVVAMDAILSR
jgi:hypothetical protein